MKSFFKDLILAGFFIWAFWSLFKDYKVYRLNMDEHEYVRKSVYFDLFRRGNFKDELWQHFDSYDQPKLAEYVYGLALHLAGHRDIARHLAEVDFDQGWTRDKSGEKLWSPDKWWVRFDGKNLSAPPFDLQKIELICQARKAAILFSFATLVLFFTIGTLYKNWFFGLITSFLLFKNFLFRGCCRWAIGDIPLIFFLLLTFFLCFFFIKFFNKKDYKKTLIVSVLIGLSAGLAVSTKLNGAMAFIYFFAILLALFVSGGYRKVVKRKLAATSLTIVSFVCFLVFFFLNPFLWQNTFKNLLVFPAWRIGVVRVQQRKQPEDILVTLSDKTTAVFENTVLSPKSWLFLRSKDRTRNFPLDLFLFVGGLVVLGAYFYKEVFVKKRPGKNFLVLLWVATLFSCVTAYISLNWDRYFLPLIPPIIFVQTIAVFWILSSVYCVLREKIVNKNEEK